MARGDLEFRPLLERDVRLLLDQGVVRDLVIFGTGAKWGVIVGTEEARGFLISEKSRKPRMFAKLDTAAAWVNALGIKRFSVDMTTSDGFL